MLGVQLAHDWEILASFRDIVHILACSFRPLGSVGGDSWQKCSITTLSKLEFQVSAQVRQAWDNG